MEAFTGLVNALFGLAWRIFSLFIELVVYILSFFLLIFQSIMRALHIG